MTFQPGYAAYTQAFGTAPAGVNFPFYGTVAPASTNTQGNFGTFQIGQQWIVPGTGVWELIGLTASNGSLSATWVQLASSSGDILAINGTANQVTVTTSAGTATVSLPSAITTPGSLVTTTTLSSGTTLGAGTSMSAGTSITAGTTITATLGNITATNGNIVLGTAGNKFVSTSVGTTTAAGANTFGSVALNGTANTTVSTTSVTAASLIFLQNIALGTVTIASTYAVSAISAGVSFTIHPSVTTDTSTIAYMIIN